MTSIYYHTGAHVPPPFCFELIIDVDFVPDGCGLDLKLNYTHREDLSAEEIENEGFTDHDDFQWNGHLPTAWRVYMEEFISKAKKGESEKQPNFVISAPEGIKSVDNEYQVEDFVQELIQAVFEASKTERTWQLALLINSNKISKTTEIEISFAERKVHRPHGKDLSWQEGKKLMELIYKCEIIDENIRKRMPEDDGLFLSFEKGLWYKLGQGLVSPYGNKQQIKKLETFLENLFL